MEVITMQSEAYKELIGKIHTIERYIIESRQETMNTDDMWVDSQDVCKFLKISERTLQRLRTNRIITYSVIGGKTYYTISEIKRILKAKRIRRSEECADALVHNYKIHLKGKGHE